MIMQTSQKPKHSIGQQIFYGLFAGCSFELLVQINFWLAFRSRHPIEIDKLYEAAGVVLLVSGVLLFIVLLAMSGSKSKLVVWSLIIALLAILAATIFSPLNVVRARHLPFSFTIEVRQKEFSHRLTLQQDVRCIPAFALAPPGFAFNLPTMTAKKSVTNQFSI